MPICGRAPSSWPRQTPTLRVGKVANRHAEQEYDCLPKRQAKQDTILNLQVRWNFLTLSYTFAHPLIPGFLTVVLLHSLLHSLLAAPFALDCSQRAILRNP